MGDVIRNLEIVEPGTLKVGDRGEATAIKEFIAGQVSLDLGFTGDLPASAGIQSASAVALGLTADHRVVCVASAHADADPLVISAVKGIAGGIQVTAMNASASAINPATAVLNFFAWRQ